MTAEFASLLIGTLPLDGVLLGALLLTIVRGGVDPDSAARLSWQILGVVALQGAHFGEELATGFYLRFPQLLGLTAWPVEFFLAFNLSWLALWSLSALGLAAFPRIALVSVWFLALGSLLNGLVHPVLALMEGGYFPGLVSSPLSGVAGLWLLRRLAVLTAADGRRS